jgi:hypothetical protein
LCWNSKAIEDSKATGAGGYRGKSSQGFCLILISQVLYEEDKEYLVKFKYVFEV